ncbi:hypothetical protein JUJ52_03465 [Virgibacillus sp. AGTR]|uniref:hypothetical protein n=1 Tax=Virgibacillus sp. AGTR TaxID=2812055 RepID=UPI001D168EAA|nr:hypothetical protein [Virgibacillus sp. AGTR]MCC2249016.1 hypothetical protein [Virgibacillus sp. AGTR]
MDGLQAMTKLSTITEEINALQKVISRMELDRDFRNECSTLTLLKERLEKEKTNLESKLQSITF